MAITTPEGRGYVDLVVAEHIADPTSQIRDALADVDAITAKVAQATTQTGVLGLVTVNFGTEVFNQGCDLTPASQIEIVTPGLYLITGKAWWSNGSGVRSLVVYVNGGHTFELAGTASSELRVAGGDVVPLAAGAVITAQSYSDSSASLRSGTSNTSLAVTRIGA